MTVIENTSMDNKNIDFQMKREKINSGIRTRITQWTSSDTEIL